MKKIFIVLCFCFLFFSCQSISKSDFFIINETYSLNGSSHEVFNEKIFRFGNKAGKNVLMIFGIDRYQESVEKDIYSNNGDVLKEKFIEIINANIFYDKGSDINSHTAYRWKNKKLTTANSNFLVIVTDNENNFFDYIINYCKENNVKFDYFLIDMHGTPSSIGINKLQKYIYRADIINKFNDAKNIANCFKKDCSAIAFSCKILSDEIVPSFAVFLKAITGINDFSASKNITVIVRPEPKFIYTVIGEFEKIPDIPSYNIMQVYSYYQKYVKIVAEEKIGNHTHYTLELVIPSEILSEEYDIKKANYYVIGHYDGDKVVLYKNNITNKTMINFDRPAWADIDFNNPKTVSSLQFSSFLEFFCEIHRGDDCKIVIK